MIIYSQQFPRRERNGEEMKKVFILSKGCYFHSSLSSFHFEFRIKFHAEIQAIKPLINSVKNDPSFTQSLIVHHGKFIM